MRPRQILAANLKTLMGARAHLDTLQKIVAATQGRLSNGKLDRVRRGVSATDIDTLEELADTFQVEPWQLLVPNLQPSTLPVLNGEDLLQRIHKLVGSQLEVKNVQPSGKPSPASSTVKPKLNSRKVVLGSALKAGFKAGGGSGDAGHQAGRVPKSGRGKRA